MSLNVSLHRVSLSENLHSRTLRLRVEEIVGAGAEEGGEGGGEGVGAGGRHVVGSVAGRGRVVAGHGGGGRGREGLGGGGQRGLGRQVGQLGGVDCAQWGPLGSGSSSLERTPGLGRHVVVLHGTGGTGALSLVVRPGQLVARRLFTSAQLGLDAGLAVGRGRSPARVVVVVGRRAPLPAALLLVQPLRLPELCSPVLEPNLAGRIAGYNSVCSREERNYVYLSQSGLSDHQFLFLIFSTRTLMSNKPGISP